MSDARPPARKLHRIAHEEMLEMASLGSKVLQIRSVEFAGKYKVPLRVLSSFEDDPGTLISLEEGNEMEAPIISGIAFTRDEAKITVTGVPDIPGIAFQVIGPVSEAGIEVDVIVQNVSADGTTTDIEGVPEVDHGGQGGLGDIYRQAAGLRANPGNCRSYSRGNQRAQCHC